MLNYKASLYKILSSTNAKTFSHHKTPIRLFCIDNYKSMHLNIKMCVLCSVIYYLYNHIINNIIVLNRKEIYTG